MPGHANAVPDGGKRMAMDLDPKWRPGMLPALAGKVSRGKVAWALVGIALTLAVFCIGLKILLSHPGIPLLLHERGAVWIRFPQPFQLKIHWAETRLTRFRCLFKTDQIPSAALLNFRSMRRAEVFVDGRNIYRTTKDPIRWRESHGIDLEPWLSPGRHELRIDVYNVNGHPALLARCEALGINSGTDWEASEDGRTWFPAISVDHVPPLSISHTFLTSDRALLKLLPFFLCIFTVVFLATMYLNLLLYRAGKPVPDRYVGAVRWSVMAGWLIMGMVNFWNIPPHMGMDVEGHLQYIQSVAESWRIPLANEGWQMFQPPLYYLIAGSMYRLFLGMCDAETVVRIVKLASLLCGMAQVEIVYRTIRCAFPKRPALQIAGTLFGGLLPMNLYMSQSLGNEPLAGVMTALIIMIACRIFAGSMETSRETTALIGFILGLALLTKVTAILVIPPLLVFLAREAAGHGDAFWKSLRKFLRHAVVVIVVALIVSGWYYLRNRMEMGRFFVGGWDVFRDIVWWQDPGYRTLRQCFQFGTSLWKPFFASIYGFWDAIYSSLWADGYLSAYNRPPWSYDFMLSCIWFSLLPTALILFGMISAFFEEKGPLGRMLRFSVSCIILYLGAVFAVFLTVPILSSAKASYALGLIPCLALVATSGIARLTVHPVGKAVFSGFFACWAVSAYVSFLTL